MWRSKFETEGLGRVEELEGSKTKISARVVEAEETIDSLNQKISATEKTKHRLETELEDLQLEYERVHAAAIITEKRGRNFDKVKYKNFHSLRRHKNIIPVDLLYSFQCFRLSENGRLRWTIWVLNLMQVKKNAETTTVSSSV